VVDVELDALASLKERLVFRFGYVILGQLMFLSEYRSNMILHLQLTILLEPGKCGAQTLAAV